MPDDFDEIAAFAAKDKEVARVGIGFERFLDKKKAAPHVCVPCRKPDPHTGWDRDHALPSRAAAMRDSAATSMFEPTRKTRPLDSTTSTKTALALEGKDFPAHPIEGGAIVTGTKPVFAVWFLDLKALMQRRKRLDVIPCRRATADTFAPGPVASATICSFSATLPKRRVETTAKLCVGPYPDIATDISTPRMTLGQKKSFRP
jgi:hypothetical protein